MRRMKVPSLSPQQEEVLGAQRITAEGPGTVLHDFDVLLRFIGTNGVETAGELLLRAVDSWRRIPKNGRKYSTEQRGSADLYKDIDYGRYNLAFLWLFGLVEVEQGAPLPKKTWCPAAVRHVPLGDALVTVLDHADLVADPLDIFAAIFGAGDEEDDDEEEDEGQQDDDGAGDDREAKSDQTDENDEAVTAIALDELQPVLRPYFPQWERALTLPPLEFREGVHVFKVVLKGWKVWRRFAVPDEATWDDFGDAIRRSLNFDDEHLWAFTISDGFSERVQITRGDAFDLSPDEGVNGSEVQIGGPPLRVGEPFPFVYDFGDSWTFEVVLERIDPPDPKLKRPKLLEKHGKSPKQYTEWDE